MADSSIRTVARVRGNDFFAGHQAYYAGATDSVFCTICESQLAGGGWEHTVSQCAHPALRGMIINRHDEVVHLVRDAITTARHGNAAVRIEADLKDEGTRRRLFPNIPDPRDDANGEAQSMLTTPTEWDVSPDCPEWDGLPGDRLDDSTLHGYEEPTPAPPLQAVEEGPDITLHDSRLNRGAPGPVRIGPEEYAALPFRPCPGPPGGGCGRQSRTVPHDLLATTGVNYIQHDTPDIVMIEPPGDNPSRGRVQLIEIAVCLEHRAAATIATKRTKYLPLRTALANKGYTVPPLEVVVVFARGAIPMSTLDTLHRLGVNPGPTEALLRKAHMITTTYLRRLCHTRRAVEATTMGAHGIVTRLIANKKARYASSSLKKRGKRKSRR